MLKNMIAVILTTFLLGAFSLNGQTPAAAAPASSTVTGVVASVEEETLVVGTAAGQVSAALSASTQYKRLSAERPSLQTATASSLSEITVGDKVIVTGLLATDGKSVRARSVYLLRQSDVAAKNAKDVEQWRTRGISGKVLAVDQETRQISVETRSVTGASTVAVTPKDDVRFLRYAPDSIRFDEAKASKLDEIKPGDMLRAVGDRNPDGTAFAAEQILTGAFQTIAGTVISVSAPQNEVVIKDLQTNKDVTIAFSATSVLKRFPAEMAQRMAGGGGVRPAGDVRPAGAVRPPGGGPGRPSNRSIDEMIERFPDITASDLKAGDMIAISSTRNMGGDRITAIKLLAGVEPFIRAQTPRGGQGRPGVDGGFSIPGLDGAGFP